ncbi:MAG: hypothetical protein GF398_07365 [Chitinivibrionales bacterium]|nr:hypothetical protein [Chitinivibrionales bacterium]
MEMQSASSISAWNDFVKLASIARSRNPALSGALAAKPSPGTGTTKSSLTPAHSPGRFEHNSVYATMRKQQPALSIGRNFDAYA